jgi:hypothetical protein
MDQVSAGEVGEEHMTTRTWSFAVSALTLMVVCTLASASIATELDPHVLAQLDERGGYRILRTGFSIRVFDDGRIEALEMDKWTEIGRLSEATVLRMKGVTDAITLSDLSAPEDTSLPTPRRWSIPSGIGLVKSCSSQSGTDTTHSCCREA